MRIVFVRHGEPDYAHDCLTETGRLQAAAAARRLASEPISAVYSSPNGRAFETAGYTARQFGLTVQKLDYMHEISWGGEGVPEMGHPWTLSEWMIDREAFDFFSGDWRSHPYFKNNIALKYYDSICGKIDAFLLFEAVTGISRAEAAGRKPLPCSAMAGLGPACLHTCFPCPSRMCARFSPMILPPLSSWSSLSARDSMCIRGWNCSMI